MLRFHFILGASLRNFIQYYGLVLRVDVIASSLSDIANDIVDYLLFVIVYSIHIVIITSSLNLIFNINIFNDFMGFLGFF